MWRRRSSTRGHKRTGAFFPPRLRRRPVALACHVCCITWPPWRRGRTAAKTKCSTTRRPRLRPAPDPLSSASTGRRRPLAGQSSSARCLPASHSPASPGDLEIHRLERLLSPRIRPASTSRGRLLSPRIRPASTSRGLLLSPRIRSASISRGRLLLTEGGGLLPAEAGAASGEPELSR
jgi:hypothetical protein